MARFRNTACVGGTKNGTCYTTAECALKAGVASGTCAQGYGVCCICAYEYSNEGLRHGWKTYNTFSVTASCGQTFSQNCTYFDSSAVTSGMCTATICKCSGTISQVTHIHISATRIISSSISFNNFQMRLDFNNFVIRYVLEFTDRMYTSATRLNFYAAFPAVVLQRPQ